MAHRNESFRTIHVQWNGKSKLVTIRDSFSLWDAIREVVDKHSIEDGTLTDFFVEIGNSEVTGAEQLEKDARYELKRRQKESDDPEAASEELVKILRDIEKATNANKETDDGAPTGSHKIDEMPGARQKHPRATQQRARAAVEHKRAQKEEEKRMRAQRREAKALLRKKRDRPALDEFEISESSASPTVQPPAKRIEKSIEKKSEVKSSTETKPRSHVH